MVWSDGRVESVVFVRCKSLQVSALNFAINSNADAAALKREETKTKTAIGGSLRWF